MQRADERGQRGTTRGTGVQFTCRGPRVGHGGGLGPGHCMHPRLI